MKEALKLALNALENHGDAYIGHSTQYFLAIEIAKEALAQQAERERKENLDFTEEELELRKKCGLEWLERFKSDTVAQPEPLPNLYVKDINGNYHPYKEKGHTENCAAFGDDCSENHLPPSHVGVGENDYTSQTELDPVARAMLMPVKGDFIDAITPDEHARVEGEYKHPLYTTPSQRKPWVDLTVEQMVDLVRNYRDVPATLVGETEAKLRKLNEAAHGIKGDAC